MELLSPTLRPRSRHSVPESRCARPSRCVRRCRRVGGCLRPPAGWRCRFRRAKFAPAIDASGLTLDQLVLGYAGLVMLTEPATIPPDDAVLTCGPAVWADLIGSRSYRRPRCSSGSRQLKREEIAQDLGVCLSSASSTGHSDIIAEKLASPPALELYTGYLSLAWAA